jgi:hypothetical protein
MPQPDPPAPQQVEAAKGQRGGGGGMVSALMSMGFEELLWFTVSSLLEK